MVFSLCVVQLWGAGANQEVVRTPPDIYQKHIEKLITPLEKIVYGKTAFPDDTSGGVTLLSETIYYRDDSGVLYRAIHLIHHAINESAVKKVASDAFTFDRERESIFLITAHTILPDGTRHAVEAKGTFIQTPQREADSALYTSNSELNIIYPDVSPGASAESIVLIRENISIISGEFAMFRTFGGGWPTFLRRVVVDLPKAEWGRVNVHTNMAGVPEAQIENYASSRQRRVWSASLVPRLSWEESSPEIQFCAPTLWFTTLSSWDQIAAWFDTLVASRSDLGPDLQAEVEKWTKGLTDRQQIVEILQDKVANQIRYTGLEFGLAGYQPNPCHDVWANRYGDCKDKANLLRAMLAHKGIVAHVALLNTDTLGRIEKASPSWNQFTHAITAVEDGKGGYFFCDPTVKFLPAGILPLSDLGREVMVVEGKTAHWLKTPDQLNAFLGFRVNASLSADGELSGWFTLEASGSDAPYYAEYFGEKDHDDLLRSMQKYLEAFFPGSVVMDTEFSPPNTAVKTTAVKAYFVRPSRAATGESLRFPYPGDWLPEFSTTGDRHFPYGTNRREETMVATITLPHGWRARKLPETFSAPSNVAHFHASWKTPEDKLVAEFKWRPEQAELAASDYAVYQSSVRALKAWLEQPALLNQEESNAVATGPASDVEGEDLPGFPILPTGEGQLRLLQERFPAGEKDVQRLAALHKILQWFPADSDTVFTAQIQIALIEREKIGAKAYAERISDCLERYRKKVTPTLRAWGEYLEAKARWVAMKDPSAIKRLQALAVDHTLPAYRRTWSAYDAAVFLAEKDPAKARDFLEPFATVTGDAQSKNIALVLKLMLQTRGDKGIEKLIRDVSASAGSEADALLSDALPTLAEDWKDLPEATRGNGSAALNRAIASTAAYPLAYPQVMKLVAQSHEADACRAFISSLREYLAKNPPSWWAKQKDSRFTSFEAVTHFIEERNDASDGEGTLNGIFQLCLYHEPKLVPLAKYTRWALWWLDHRKKDEDLLGVIATESLKLPAATTEEVVECWLIYAEHFTHLNKGEEALVWYQRVRDNPDAHNYQRVKASGEIAKLLLKKGEVDTALAEIKKLEPIHTSLRKGIDYLFIGLLVHLERGEYDRALELVARIREQDSKYLADAVYTAPLTHLLRAAEHPDRLRNYWERSKRWRPRWNALLVDAGLPVPGIENPPAETDFAALNERLAASLTSANKAEFIHNLDTFARLAQWIPLFTNDFALQVVKSARISKETFRALNECLLSMVQDLDPVDPHFDSIGKLWEAAVMGDLGEKRKALVKAKALYLSAGGTTPVGSAALRIWVEFAEKEPDLSEALATMKQQLETPAVYASRNEVVREYSDALTRQPDRMAEHAAFLEKETSRPGFEPNSDLGKILSSRLATLRNQFSSATQLSKEISAWKATQDLTWLDHVAPHSLDEPRFAELKGPIDLGQSRIGGGEIIKYDLLLAEDEKLTAEERGNAFVKAALFISWTTNSAEKFADAIVGGISMRSLPPTASGMLAVSGEHLLLDKGYYEAARRIHKTIRADSISAERLASLSASEQACQLMSQQPNGWGKEAFSILTSQPIDHLRGNMVTRLLDRLAMTGAAAEGEALLEQSDKLTLDPSLTLSLSALRLQWARTLRSAKSEEPFVTAFREKLLALPEAKPPISAFILQRMDPDSLGGLNEAEYFQMALRELQNFSAHNSSLYQATHALQQAHALRKRETALGTELLKLAIEMPGEDLLKSMRIRAIFILCDHDIPEVQRICETTFKAYLDSTASRSFPLTRQAIAGSMAHMALRESTELRPRAIFELLAQVEAPAAEQQRVKFLFHVSRGQDAEAIPLLDQMDPETMASLYAPASKLLTATGRTTELNLLKESAKEKLQKMLADGWAEPEGIRQVFDPILLAIDMGQPELIPAEWLERIGSKWVDSPKKLHFAVLQARLHEDWAGLKKGTDAFLAAIPDYYSMYWYRAEAMNKLGDEAGEREALSVYLKYSRNEPNYQQASKRFNELVSPAKS